MTTETYEILALKYGSQTNRTRYFNFMHDDDQASPGPIDYFIWVIRNENRTIVIDRHARGLALARHQRIDQRLQPALPLRFRKQALGQQRPAGTRHRRQ